MSEPATTPPRILLEVVRGSVSLDEIDGGWAASFSERCPGKTRANEDAAALLPLGEGRLLLIVADGLGGQPGADQASGLTVRLLVRSLEPARTGSGDPGALLLAGLKDANEAVEQLGLGAGTTLAAALVLDGHARAFHVGDSVVMLVDQHGGVKFVTVPHSPIGYALAAGMLTEEEALHHPERHIISNMVGSPQMLPEVGPDVELEPGDTLIVASDGVVDNLYRAELAEILRGPDLARVAEELVGLCRERMAGRGSQVPSKPDDATFLIYRRR